jgi:hypothetical protein
MAASQLHAADASASARSSELDRAPTTGRRKPRAEIMHLLIDVPAWLLERGG